MGDIAVAVARHFGLQPGPGLSLWPGDAHADWSEPLDPSLTPAQAGLVSGATLSLNRPPSQPTPIGLGGLDPAVVKRQVSVRSGPDVGRTVDLEPGGSRASVGREVSSTLVMADPGLGRQHLWLWADADGGVWVEPGPEATTDVRVDGEIITTPRLLEPGALVVTANSSLAVSQTQSVPPALGRPDGSGSFAGAGSSAGGPIIDAHGRVPFHRTPYFPDPVRPVELHPVSEVPSRPERPRFAYLAAAAPLVVAVALAAAFRSPQYLLIGLFAPVMAVAGYFEHKRRVGDQFAASVDRFNLELVEAESVLAGAEEAERSRRFTAAPDLVEHHRRAELAGPELWVRSREATDFLQLRLGLGSVEPATRVVLPSGGDPEFRQRMDEALARAGHLGQSKLIDVPVTIDLAALGTVGLVGRLSDVDALAASLVIQAACWHSPEDMVVLAAADRSLDGWLKWLPHAHSGASPIEGDHVVVDKAAGDALVDALLVEADRRVTAGSGAGGSGEVERFPWLVVVLDRFLELEPTMVSRLLDVAPSVGMSVLWLADSAQWVPRQARAVVACRSPIDPGPSTVDYTDPNRVDASFTAERLTPARAAATARALAPRRDASATDAVTAIPTTVTLFDSLGVGSVSRRWVLDQWLASLASDRTRPGGPSLAAPIGATDAGPLVIDLVEHGPHALIGGTSGAGKSELLMSMVASMMAHHPPNKLNFLFVDYKGGASSEVFRHAPHTVGCVTNLDATLANRALVSLGAELNRRMRLLAGRAKDMGELRASGADDVAPSLVIVIDEFATLVNEVPGFVDGVVDIAQRGRSLGIHLVLATQRPSGVINDNIKANTNLRIALRMLDDAESRSVIGSGEAATLPGPLKGRGYVNRGDGRLLAFQSAWSGAPLLSPLGSSPVLVEPFVGAGGGDDEPAPRLSDQWPLPGDGVVAGTDGVMGVDDATSQLEALMSVVEAATEAGGYERGPSPWVEALPDVVLLGDALARHDALVANGSSSRRRPGRDIVIGLVDAPEEQDQYPAVVDLESAGGLLILGAPGSGTSSALRTLAVSAALDSTVADASADLDSADVGTAGLTLVGLDFGSRRLAGLADLPQSATIAPGDDLEAVTRVITVLGDHFERRRDGLEGPPIILLIDGLDNLTQTLDQGSHTQGLPAYFDRLVDIIVNGRSVGIYTVATAMRRVGLRMNLVGAFTERILLRQSDTTDYLDAGVSSQAAGDLNLQPGQGLWSGARVAHATVQLARLAGTDDRDEDATVAKVAAGLVGTPIAELSTGPLPRSVSLAVVSEAVTSCCAGVDRIAGVDTDPRRPLIGLADLTLCPVTVDLTFENLYVHGEPRTGRSTALATITTQVAEAGGEVWVMAPPASPLAAWPGAHRRAVGDPDHYRALLADLAEAAEAGADDGNFRLLVIDDLDRVADGDFELEQALVAALGSGRWVVSGPRLTGFVSDQSLATANKARTKLYLSPADLRDATDVFETAVPWHPGLPMVPGRGLLMADRRLTIVQVAEPPS